jgi:hypothetical protein
MLKNLLTLAIVLAILGWIVNINAAHAEMQCDPDAGSACWPSNPQEYQPAPGPNIQPAPAPVAGAGLGYLILAGGYYAVRRWRKL